MFEKFKRFIPQITIKFNKKEDVTKNSNGSNSNNTETNYQYLCNGPVYRNANIITKLWYLRGRFDWFDDVSQKNKITANTSVKMLKEIMEELENLAYLMENMDNVCTILNLKNMVNAYYLQYTEDLNKENNLFDVQVNYRSPIYEQIWCLRYMFDCACASNNKQIYQDVCNWLKTLQLSAEEDEVKAIKEILKDVQREKRKSTLIDLKK